MKSLALAVGLTALSAVASAAPLSEAEVAKAADQAYAHWKVSLREAGLSGLQAEVAGCYAKLKARPTQARAVYCAALDHYSLLDAMNFPPALAPPYFKTDAVFKRLDDAVAQSAAAQDRKELTRRLLVEADEAIRRKR